MQYDSDFGTFFLPGPTEVREEVLRAMLKPMILPAGAAVGDRRPDRQQLRLPHLERDRGRHREHVPPREGPRVADELTAAPVVGSRDGKAGEAEPVEASAKNICTSR